MKVGYARVATSDPDMDTQLVALQQAGCRQVFTDGSDVVWKKQTGIETALDYMQEGDILVVWSLTCLGRSLKQLVDTVNQLRKQGLGFQSLQEAVDTTAADGLFIYHVFAVLAEFERNVIRERTQAGLRAARARGRRGGRPKRLDTEKTKLAHQLYDERQLTIVEICGLLGISKSTLYAYLRTKETK